MILNFDVTIEKMEKCTFIEVNRSLWAFFNNYPINKLTNQINIIDVIGTLYSSNLELLSHVDRRVLQKYIKEILGLILRMTKLSTKKTLKDRYNKICNNFYQKHRHWLFDGYINRFDRVIKKPTRFGFTNKI